MPANFRHLAEVFAARWWPVPGSRRPDPFALVVAAPLALVLLAAAETSHLPGYVFARLPGQTLLVFLQGLFAAASSLWPAWLFALALSCLLAADLRRDLGTRAFSAIAGVLASLAVSCAYVTLVRYRSFVGHVPFIALHAGVLVLAVACAFALRGRPEPRYKAASRLLRAAPDLASISAIVLYAWGYTSQRGQYPTLHLALLVDAALLGSAGIASLFARGLPGLPSRVGGRAVLAVLLAIPFAGALAVRGLPSASRADSLLRQYADVGAARLIFAPQDKASATAAAPSVGRDKSGVGRFLAASALPKLPDKLKLTNYNVLLVMSEAMRYDRTSLADPAQRTTPTLRSMADRGAFSFTRAYTPSSNTLQALAGVFTMTWPSLTPLEVWEKSWDGYLLPKAETVTELFEEAGYDTFSVTHDRNRCFTSWMQGLDQGFDWVERVPEPTRSGPRSPELDDPATTDRPADEQITDLVLQMLDHVGTGRRPFFGWVFYVSPHAEYLAHYEDMPADTDEQRYLQEIRYTDSQVRRLLAALEDRGLLEHTIVIFTADHGEEFEEHGGRTHASTVYEEQIHVPLVVYVPGMHGSTIRRPTSSLYVLPWLLLHGNSRMRAAVQAKLRSDIGPMLRATGGAVVSELLGHTRMSTALIRGGRKAIHDFHSGLDELYSLEPDPGEKLNLLLLDPERYPDERELIRSYEEVRAAREAFALTGPRGSLAGVHPATSAMPARGLTVGHLPGKKPARH
jgi:arylsulfatase A-like enzyme